MGKLSEANEPKTFGKAQVDCGAVHYLCRYMKLSDVAKSEQFNSRSLGAAVLRPAPRGTINVTNGENGYDTSISSPKTNKQSNR